MTQSVNENDASGAVSSPGGQAARSPEPLLLRPAVVLLWLSTITVLFFLLTLFLVRASQARRRGLAESWAKKASHALSAHDAGTAAADLRNALLYAPDNPEHRLKLAQALLASGRADEAQLYLEGLWEDEPASGRVNLELARLAVFHHDVAGALRFYHGAIYGLWGDTTESHPRQVRLELVDFLLREKFPTLARSELIALEPDIVADPALQLRVAALYVRAGDPESALRVYQKVLRAREDDPAALAGAGDSAFQLGRYALAQGYLQEAVERDPKDAPSRETLQTATLILAVDPYQPGLTGRGRAERAEEAFRQAGALLESCEAPPEGAPGPATDGVRAHWTELKPRVSQARLRRDPEFFDQTMEVIGEVARSARPDCEQARLRQALLAVTKESGDSR